MHRLQLSDRERPVILEKTHVDRVSKCRSVQLLRHRKKMAKRRQRLKAAQLKWSASLHPSLLRPTISKLSTRRPGIPQLPLVYITLKIFMIKSGAI